MRVVSARWSLATTIFFGLSICGLLCTAYIPVDAQQRSKFRRLGYLGSGAGIDDREEKLRDGLKELGYIEGQNLAIEWRFANGEEKRLPELAAELVRFKPDVIITTGTSPARALRDSTKMIPIVVASAGDLVGRKIVASLARPGGNITGFTSISPELNSKRLEILKEVVPRASRVAFLYQRHETDELKQLEIAAGTLSLHIQRHRWTGPATFRMPMSPWPETAPMQFLYLAIHSLTLTDKSLSNSQQKTGCRRCVTGQNGQTPAVPSLTDRTALKDRIAPPCSSTKS